MSMREKIWRTIQQQNLDNGGAAIQNHEAMMIADAVLDALMEPTEGMMTSAAYSDISTSYGDEDSFEYVSDEDAAAIFAKMVRAAKEGK
jgi:hypothetical protein